MSSDPPSSVVVLSPLRGANNMRFLKKESSNIQPDIIGAPLGFFFLFSLYLFLILTGATDGIGKAYAIGLAEKGIDVVLISRTEAKLEEVKKEIEDKGYGVKVKYIGKNSVTILYLTSVRQKTVILVAIF